MSSAEPPCSQNKNLIINYIPTAITELELRDLFSQVGALTSLRIMKNQDNSPKGFGFVNFVKYDHAVEAISRFNGFHIMGKRLKVAFTVGGGPRHDCNVFASRLPPSWTSDDLKSVFKEFGDLIEARVLQQGGYGSSRRCGFVRFKTQRAAKDAVRHMHLFKPPGSAYSIKLRIATKQSEHWRNKRAKVPRPHFKKQSRCVEDRSLAKQRPRRNSHGVVEPVFHLGGHGSNMMRKISLPTFIYAFDTEFDLIINRHFSEEKWLMVLLFEDVERKLLILGSFARNHVKNRHVELLFFDWKQNVVQDPEQSIQISFIECLRFAQFQTNAENKHQLRTLEHYIKEDMATSVAKMERSKLHAASVPAPPIWEDFDVQASKIIPETHGPDSLDPKRGVFLYNLPLIFTSDHILTFCKTYGNIEKVHLQTDNAGNSVGMAYVLFTLPSSAQSACESLSDCRIHDYKIAAMLM